MTTNGSISSYPISPLSRVACKTDYGIEIKTPYISFYRYVSESARNQPSSKKISSRPSVQHYQVTGTLTYALNVEEGKPFDAMSIHYAESGARFLEAVEYQNDENTCALFSVRPLDTSVRVRTPTRDLRIKTEALGKEQKKKCFMSALEYIRNTDKSRTVTELSRLSVCERSCQSNNECSKSLENNMK
uniref:Putative lipocalin-3 1 n=1 Tax=Amblyomma cajennense TaxID=34607 RepID=A0A023FDD6_AMBCJ